MKPIISIVVPCYNEGGSIFPFFSDLNHELIQLKKYNFEVLFINDGSSDQTWEKIKELGEVHDTVKGINFSRNFGKEIALTAGLQHAHGEAVITIDADGQHPVSKLPEFIEAWEEGFDIVYNKRPNTSGISFAKKTSSQLFYSVFNRLSTFQLEAGTTDYRLLSRKVVVEFLRFGEKNRLYRGLTDWLGFSKKVLVFDANERLYGGTAAYSYKSLFQLAINSMTSFSFFPLKLVGYLGLLMTLISSLLFLFVVIDKFTVDNFSFSYVAALLLINMTLVGIVLMSLGLIALYIAHIHEEVLARPMYVVQETLNYKK